MILEVQIKTFSAPAHGSQSFWLLNILGGPNINIFCCETLREAFFYILEQMKNNEFKIWALKTTILDPRKSRFLVLEEKPKTKFCLRVLALIQH